MSWWSSPVFRDRADAGRRLADALAHLRVERDARGDPDVVVVGLPRGGVPVAAEVAAVLDVPLDVVVVRKLGVPSQPELAMGAIGERGVRVLNDDVVRVLQIAPEVIDRVERRERAELERRVDRFRSGLAGHDLDGRTVVVVDDGIATGSTARAACRVVRALGARRVVLAVPVAPPGWHAGADDGVDELVCVARPEQFSAVGQWYDDFTQTTDDEVVELLALSRQRARRDTD